MKGVVVHYKQNRHAFDGNQLIVLPEGSDNREKAAALVGKSVSWNTGKQDLVGKVASAHGNSGAVRVIFEKGMPGQCLGQHVKIQ